jgi:hypothetical protein
MLYSLKFMSYYIELVNIAHPYITPFPKCPCPWKIELRIDQCKCRHPREGKRGAGMLLPGRSHGSPGVTTWLTMCYFSYVGQLFTFDNITAAAASAVAAEVAAEAASVAAAAAAVAAGINSIFLSSPYQRGRYGPACPVRQYGQYKSLIYDATLLQLSRAARRAVPALYSFLPLWLYPLAPHPCLSALAQ